MCMHSRGIDEAGRVNAEPDLVGRDEDKVALVEPVVVADLRCGLAVDRVGSGVVHNHGERGALQ